MIFPKKISDYVKDLNYSMNGIGMSESQVYIYEKYVLKVQTATPETDNEFEVLKWLAGRCPTPTILEYEKEAGMAFTLMTKAARFNVENGKVDLDNVEPDTFGPNGFANPMELLTWLENNRPEEDLVLSHGDFCLPNIFTDGKTITSFIDNGRWVQRTDGRILL